VTGLAALFNANSGIICAVGAGGKKTTLYRIAAEHPGRTAITASVMTLPAPEQFRDQEVTAPAERLLDAVTGATGRRLFYALPSDKPGRCAGVPPDLIAAIHSAGQFDATFVKADGARMRLIKAPAEDEPQIPPGTVTVIPVVSARVIGMPLTEKSAHRAERVAAVTGANVGESLTPAHIARLLASPEGALKGAGDAAVVPVINMVDDAELLAAARSAARAALALTRRFERVILTCMTAEAPVVEVVDAKRHAGGS